MTSQYVSRQWSGLPTGVAGPGGASLERTQEDNPNFLYPGPYRRDLGGGNPQIIQRGFMRSLLGSFSEDVAGVLGNSRFFFQFNPQQIQRAVAVSGGLMNPLLQDPGQFSVATPGNATFSFDIFLNREAEVNARSNFIAPPTFGEELLVGLPGAQGQSQGVIAPVYKPKIEQNPGKYGVLSDIQVLDNIIGQGITEKTISALAKLQSISSSYDTSETSSGASVSGAATNYKTAEEMTSALTNIQFGNSAFLISTPVRIVFSSMFMVDGFIQGSNILFSKFSGDMIPTVCAINITVEAKYIGFAREKTYLTDSLKGAIENPNKDGTAIPQPTVGNPAEYELLRNLIIGLPKYQFVIAGDNNDDNATRWDGRGDTADLDDVLGYEVVLCRFGFMDDTNEEGTSSTISRTYVEGKYAITISHTPALRVWRRYLNDAEGILGARAITNTEPGPGRELTGVAEGFPAFTPFQIGLSRDVLLLEMIPPTVTSRDYDSWRKWHAYGGGAGSNEGANNSKTSDKTVDTPINKVLEQAKAIGKTQDDAERAYLPSAYSLDKDSYYVLVDVILRVEAEIKSKTNIDAPSSLTFEIKKTFKTILGIDGFAQEIQITDKDVPKA
jgi:hypothetical protein